MSSLKFSLTLVLILFTVLAHGWILIPTIKSRIPKDGSNTPSFWLEMIAYSHIDCLGNYYPTIFSCNSWKMTSLPQGSLEIKGTELFPLLTGMASLKLKDLRIGISSWIKKIDINALYYPRVGENEVKYSEETRKLAVEVSDELETFTFEVKKQNKILELDLKVENEKNCVLQFELSNKGTKNFAMLSNENTTKSLCAFNLHRTMIALTDKTLEKTKKVSDIGSPVKFGKGTVNLNLIDTFNTEFLFVITYDEFVIEARMIDKTKAYLNFDNFLNCQSYSMKKYTLEGNIQVYHLILSSTFEEPSKKLI